MKEVRLLVLLSLCFQPIQAFQCTRSLNDVALTGHTIKSHQSSMINYCHQECMGNLFCKSINYYFHKRLCQHNNATISKKPKYKVEDKEAVYMDNPYPIEFPTHNGWTLIARFSNSDAKNWIQRSGAWWYDVTSPKGDITSTTVNQDMILPAFWKLTGQEIKITRTDDPTHTALLTTNSNCLGGQTFRAKVTSYGNFRNGAVWASDRCLGRCHVTYGGKYATTVGFKYAICDSNIQTRNNVGFWCDYSAGDGSVMMIGGGGRSCGRADHGIGITEENAAKLGTYMAYDFGGDGNWYIKTDYALNLWIK